MGPSHGRRGLMIVRVDALGLLLEARRFLIAEVLGGFFGQAALGRWWLQCAPLADGEAPAGAIARTGNNIEYARGARAYALLDFDRKGMPAAVAAVLDAQGGFWHALTKVVPELVRTGRVRRAKLYYLRGLRGKAARLREREQKG